MKAIKPLCVDLDGTLLRTDTLLEICWRLLLRHPFIFLRSIVWLARGRAYFKARVAKCIDLSAIQLPFNPHFLLYLKQQKRLSRPLYLVTAANQYVANKVVEKMEMFRSVIGSDEHVNLKGKNKADYLAEQFAGDAFDYAGNSHADYPVWEKSGEVFVVNANKRVTKKAMSLDKEVMIFDPPKGRFITFIKAIRVHQFAKNVLVIIPLLTAHLYTSSEAVINVLTAFFIFCLVAGSVYLLNDLVDLDADRQHQGKRSRPLASGDMSIITGIIGSLLLLVLGIGLASLLLNVNFILILLGYYVLTLAYSFVLKKKVLLDVFTLSGLYTLRIVAGIAALNTLYSTWLLVFSAFFFLSLAFLKRDIELSKLASRNLVKMRDKAYYVSDQMMIRCFGIASGFMSIVILALYINSSAVLTLYHKPQWLWGALLVIFAWITHLWFVASRGEMNGDPVLFAIRDYRSILHGVAVVAFTILAIT